MASGSAPNVAAGRLLRPRVGFAGCCVAPRGKMTYIALLLEDRAVALCAPPLMTSIPAAPSVECVLRFEEAIEAIACASDGALLGVATTTHVHVYVVSTRAGSVEARLRGRLRLLCQPRNLAIASLVPGVGEASSHGVVAAAGAAGLNLLCTETDEGVKSTVSHHRGCPLCACRFSDDGAQLALASVDGRLFVRQRPQSSAGWAAAGSSVVVWCAHLRVERVVSLDFSACGRWLALAGWRGDVAVYDTATCMGSPPTREEDFWHEWRLAWLWPVEGGEAAPSPAPSLLTWCRAPRRQSMLCCSARRAASTSTKSAGSDRLVVVDIARGSPISDIFSSACRWTGAHLWALRGSSAERCNPGHGACDAAEVVVWIDEEGHMSYEPLWSWAESAGDVGSTRSQRLASTPVESVDVIWGRTLQGAHEDNEAAALRITTLNGDDASPTIIMALPELSAAALASSDGKGRVIAGGRYIAVLGCGAIQVVERSDATDVKWQTYVVECVDACFLDEATLLLVDPSAAVHAIDLTSMTFTSASLPLVDIQLGAPFKILASASSTEVRDAGSAQFAVIAKNGTAWLGSLSGAPNISPRRCEGTFIRTSDRMVPGACIPRSTCGT